MKKLFVFIALICCLAPLESSAKKRRVFKRKWSLSLTNGYSLFSLPNSKASSRFSTEEGNIEGQMNPFFSSLDISRNMGYYEIGAKIQSSGPAFVSPFFKWNLIKNNSRAGLVPSLSFGIVPAHIFGFWFRLGFALSLNRYISLTPFIGSYGFYKIKDDENAVQNGAIYQKYNIHFNSGLRVNLYY